MNTFDRLLPRFAYTGQFALENLLPIPRGVTIGSNSTLDFSGASLTLPTGQNLNNVTQTANIISGQGATLTLTAAQSGSVALFDRAAGIVYTLPAATVGLYYDFLVPTSVTSNAHKVLTPASVFLIGSLVNIDTDSTNAVAAWTADGTTIRSVSMNGTTTGGLQGTWMRFTCVAATLWMVTGIDQGNGTVATPFATS